LNGSRRTPQVRPAAWCFEEMQMKMYGVAAGFLALTMASAASAADVGGVKLDDKASVGGQELVLNGAGIRTRAVFKVYVGSLYLPAKTANLDAVLAKGPRRIQLNLLRDLSGDQLSDAVNDGLKESNSPADVDAVKRETEQFIAILKAMGALKEGSMISIDFVEGATRIGFNGAPKGTVPGDAFNRALTKIWVGDKPVQPDLKKAMLGG
jgi:long-chain acyl-CoA synthetase